MSGHGVRSPSSDADDLSILTSVFKSPHPRGPNEKEVFGDTEAAVAVNNEFEIRLHLPQDSKNLPADVVIVVHGFGQQSDQSYLTRDMGICPRIADRGLASVLLPLPFHMNRWPKDYEAYKLVVSPTMLVVNNPTRFYQGYLQMLGDIEALVAQIDRGEIPPFASQLARQPRIHLLGHSMGGLAVLAYQLFAQIEGKRVCDSLVLLASGCSMRTISPLELGIGKHDWAPFRDFYLKDFEKSPLPEGMEQSSSEHKIFRQIFLGKQQDDLEGALETLSERTLVIIGAEDEVNALRHVSSGLDNIPKYVTLVVPEWGHLLEEHIGRSLTKKRERSTTRGYTITKEWNKWSDFILSAACRFMQWGKQSEGNVASSP